LDRGLQDCSLMNDYPTSVCVLLQAAVRVVFAVTSWTVK
jgi:hypothetical protein